MVYPGRGRRSHRLQDATCKRKESVRWLSSSKKIKSIIHISAYQPELLHNLFHFPNILSFSSSPPFSVAQSYIHLLTNWLRTVSESWFRSWQPCGLSCHLSWGISCRQTPCLFVCPLPGTARRTPSYAIRKRTERQTDWEQQKEQMLEEGWKFLIFFAWACGPGETE